MKILRTLLFTLVAIVALCAIVIMTRPDRYRVERSASIPAPPATVFAQINDFHNWAAWSPWEHLDPAMQKSFKGAASGNGAIYEWQGNKQVGSGRMTITESTPDSKVGIQLEFLAPWTATSQTAFTITPEGAGSKVTWSMEGTNNLMAKAMSVFMNMDKMIGPDFEKGLASLGDAAKKAAAAGGAPADTTKKS